jgi:Flp pilus assembly protein TadG
MPVLLAGMLTILIGMTGLAVDHGFAILERRVLQNAVDAAASSGALSLAQGVSPTTSVSTMVTRNGAAVTTNVECQYVDSTGTDTGPCTGTASNDTAGVRVTATNPRATFFMRVLGVDSVTVSATSSARVYAVSSSSPYPSSGSLFIVCGINTKLAGPGNKTKDILKQQGGQWVVNTAADGDEFVIHNPNVADCGMQSSSFKGLNATGAESGPITLPFNLVTETGTRAGPTTQAVRGINGCAAGLYSDAVDNCTMIIPVFVSAPDKEIAYSVRWLAFDIRRIDSNTHYGRLRLDYAIAQESYTLLAPWTKNTKQVLTTVRLWN